MTRRGWWAASRVAPPAPLRPKLAPPPPTCPPNLADDMQGPVCGRSRALPQDGVVRQQLVPEQLEAGQGRQARRLRDLVLRGERGRAAAGEDRGVSEYHECLSYVSRCHGHPRNNPIALICDTSHGWLTLYTLMRTRSEHLQGIMREEGRGDCYC